LTNNKEGWNVPRGIVCMLVGAFAIYGALFTTGFFLYGEIRSASLLGVATLAAFYTLWKLSRKLVE